MTPEWPLTAISQFASESRVPGSTGESARKLTVKLYGRGAVPKDERRKGSEQTRYYKRRSGQLVYSKLDFLNGAFALVPPELDGYETTLDLPAFDLSAQVDGEWLVRFLARPSFYKRFEGLAHGSRKARRVNPEEFLDIKLPLPPLAEQKRIAAILSSVDEALEKTQAVVDQLELIKKSLLEELLARGLPGRHQEFKDTELGPLPASWRTARVGDCCRIENPLRKPLNQDERARMPGPYPYYGPTRVLDYIGEYRVEGTYALIGEDGDHFLKFKKWPMTQLASGRFNVNNHAHLVAGTDSCLTEWFFYFFLHRDITEHLTRQGANRYKLKKETLTSLPIALPPLDEQRSIVEALDVGGSSIASNVRMLERLLETKEALSSALLSGELRVGRSSQEAA